MDEPDDTDMDSLIADVITIMRGMTPEGRCKFIDALVDAGLKMEGIDMEPALRHVRELIKRTRRRVMFGEEVN